MLVKKRMKGGKEEGKKEGKEGKKEDTCCLAFLDLEDS